MWRNGEFARRSGGVMGSILGSNCVIAKEIKIVSTAAMSEVQH